jgi:hypothetical protein
MTMNETDQLVARVQSVEEEGKQRFGHKEWGTYVGAIAAANPRGVDGAVMQHVLAQPNASDLIAMAGRDALIAAASNGDDQSNRAYSELRAQERREHRLSKGRGPGWA